MGERFLQFRHGKSLDASVHHGDVALVFVHVLAPPHSVVRGEQEDLVWQYRPSNKITITRQKHLRFRVVSVQANEVTEITVAQIRAEVLHPETAAVAGTDQYHGSVEFVGHYLEMWPDLTRGDMFERAAEVRRDRHWIRVRVIQGPLAEAEADLLQTANTADALRPRLGLGNRWQQQCRKQTNHDQDDQQVIPGERLHTTPGCMDLHGDQGKARRLVMTPVD